MLRVPRPTRRVILAVVVIMVVAPCLWLGYRLWNGDPYPSADPDAVAVRLKRDAQLAYDDIALPGRPGVKSSVMTGTCYYRGLRSLAHIDRGRLDVSSFHLDWKVTDVARDTARAGQERVRLRLIREGYALTSEETGEGHAMGFRFTHPDSDHTVDVKWYEPTGTLAVSAYSPCGEVPTGFNEYEWSRRAWTARP